MKRVAKVVVYVTHGSRLLVFTHSDFPEVGVQVPAGTVEPGEDLALAALREAEEETGIKNLELISYLGTADFDISVLRPEIHERHFFHVKASPPFPETWKHLEMHPSGGDAKSIAYDCYWVERAEIGKSQPALFFGQGVFLDKIPPEKADAPPPAPPRP